MTIYDELYAAVSPLVKHYRGDLEKHDREALEQWPGVPFLHWTRDTGTDLCFLPAADDECFPPYGQRVKYLFGTADREHILDGKVQIAKYHLREPSRYTAHFFSGKVLRSVTVEKSVEIAEQYARPIREKWRLDRLRNENPAEYRRLRDSGNVDRLELSTLRAIA